MRTTTALPLLLTPLALALLTTVAHAQTPVGGVIDQDTVWTGAGSPYIVEQSILIANDAILTIEAGVEVRVNPGRGFAIGSTALSLGTLVVNGTPDNRVRFVSNAPYLQDPRPAQVNDWNGLLFTPRARHTIYVDGQPAGGSILRHLTIEHANGQGPVIRTLDTGLAVIGLHLRAPATSGVDIQVNDSEASYFEDCRFEGVPSPIVVDGGSNNTFRRNTFIDINTIGSGGAINCDAGGTTTIADSTFINCRSSGYGGAIDIDSPGLVIINSTFDNCVGNGLGGAAFTSGNLTITDSTFTRNRASNASAISHSGTQATFERTHFIDNGGFIDNNGPAVLITARTTVTDSVFEGNRANRAVGAAPLRHRHHIHLRLELQGQHLDRRSVQLTRRRLYQHRLHRTPLRDRRLHLRTQQRDRSRRPQCRRPDSPTSPASVLVRNSRFAHNEALGTASSNGRGGAAFLSGSNITVRDNEFEQNAAARGGAIALSGFNVRVTNNHFLNNTAATRGGAIATIAGPSFGDVSFAGTDNTDPEPDEFNTFAGNTAPQGSAIDHAISFNAGAASDIDATDNCWNGDDPLDVVHSFFNDSTLSLVFTDPAAPCTDAPNAPCNPADLAPPTGDYTFADISTFLTTFAAGCP